MFKNKNGLAVMLAYLAGFPPIVLINLIRPLFCIFMSKLYEDMVSFSVQPLMAVQSTWHWSLRQNI